MIRTVLGLLLCLGSIAPLRAEASPEQRLRDLEQQVQSLREEIRGLRDAGAPGLEELERRIAILAAEIESLRAGTPIAAADRQQHGLGPAASKAYRQERGVSLGGYGEVLYQNFDSRTDAGAAAGATDELDFLRAVLYAGYKFNERLVLNTETEFEHASTGSGGEVSVEFGYLDFLWRPGLSVRGGLLLVPLGLVNELHEPTTFLGARRPLVETALIPTTWREIGAGIHGEAGPVAYRVFYTTALDAAKFTAGGIRGGRQKGARAKAEDFAWSGRLDFVGAPGLVVGVAGMTGNSGQNLTDAGGASIDARTTIVEGHLDWRWRGIQARALVARLSIDDVAELNAALTLTGNASIGSRQRGGYFEAGYDVLAHLPRTRQALLPFVRRETLDTQDRVPAGFARNPVNDRDLLTIGLDYRPIEAIAIKAEYQNFRNAAGTAVDQINVGLGWIF